MSSKELMLDRRTQAELNRRVEELAASYTPEWRFAQEDADVGSTLALLFTHQMADNVRRINRIPEKYHTEFVNLLGLTLQSAHPASGVAVVELMQGTVPGVALHAGTRLLAEDGENPIIFETVGDVYLTNARLTDVLSLSGTRGRILPVMGGPEPAKLGGESNESPGDWEELSGTTPMVPRFAMFDYEEPGIERNALLIYHRTIFDGDAAVPVRLLITTPEGASLARELSNQEKWRWSYMTADGLCPFEEVSVQDGIIILRREGEISPVTVDGAEYHMICLEALGPVSAALTLGELRVASNREAQAPEYILRDGEELDAAECMPFGETVSIFDECYICDDRIFSQKDAEVTISFSLSTRKKIVQLTAQQVAEDLKIIKRKPRTVQFDSVSTSPERIALEYFNGQIWRRLPCSNDWSSIMDGTHTGQYAITFRCPDDWAGVPINGYEGRSLRLRVTQADNCYLMPCEHTMPVVSDLTLSYRYLAPWKQPQKLQTICGTQFEDQTRELLEGRAVTAFQPLPYPPAALYLGFDRPMEGAPVSILFDVEENVHFKMEPVTFEYSTRKGFKPMKVIDGTENFSGAGTVLFMPPADFAAVQVEGVARWWIRICASAAAAQGYHAPVRNIRLNAVNIRNQQTQPVEEFYVDMAAPNMEFPLSVNNVLSAEVFVNELGRLSRGQMRQMLEEQPDHVQAEYDFLGEITAFFVRWTEVDSFDSSGGDDRHYVIDRMTNTLQFGDGIHVRIPQAQQDVAIRVQVMSSDGARGNLAAGALNGFYGNVMYVQSVSNPAATFAGCDMENLEGAMRRGADILSGRGRLISEIDFARAVRAFSPMVEKVKCVAGRDVDGYPDPGRITIAVMTGDYNERSCAFQNIRDPLRRRLLDRCEATLTENDLVVTEPMYVEISASVWVKADDASVAFDIQDMVLQTIRNYLEPLTRPGCNGWDIGELPTEGQLRMLLQTLRFSGHVERVITTARYTDRNGIHETSLDRLPDTPFAIGVNGEHRVYIEFQ